MNIVVHTFQSEESAKLYSTLLNTYASYNGALSVADAADLMGVEWSGDSKQRKIIYSAAKGFVAKGQLYRVRRGVYIHKDVVKAEKERLKAGKANGVHEPVQQVQTVMQVLPGGAVPQAIAHLELSLTKSGRARDLLVELALLTLKGEA